MPDGPPPAVIGTQDKTPAEVDCKTEEPVAGLVAGNVYVVFTPDCAPTKAVYKEPLNICNLPPMLIDFAIPAPPETTNPPVVDEIELSVELKVAVPVDAPNDNVVAAPKALMFVAVALKTLNVAEPVVTLVVKFGDVPNTSAPEPVSSLTTPE